MQDSGVPTFGERMRGARELAGLGQKELAARMKRSPSLVAQWEKRTTPPKRASVQLVAEALGLPPSDLLDGVQTGYEDWQADPRGASVSSAVTQPRQDRAIKEARVSDPFGTIRWEWEQLEVDDRVAALHQIQDVLRTFTTGAGKRRGHGAR